MPEKIQSLYEAASTYFDVGDFDSFKEKLKSPDKRKALFGALSEYYDLGTFDEYNAKINEALTKEQTPEQESPVGLFNTLPTDVRPSEPISLEQPEYKPYTSVVLDRFDEIDKLNEIRSQGALAKEEMRNLLDSFRAKAKVTGLTPEERNKYRQTKQQYEDLAFKGYTPNYEDMDKPLSYEDIFEQDIETDGKAPILDFTVAAILSTIDSAASALESTGGVNVEEDWIDKIQKWARIHNQKFREKYSTDTRIVPFIPFTDTDFADLAETLGYSIVPMAAAAPLMALPGGEAAAMGVSGLLAYRMASNEIMERFLEAKNEEYIERYGRKITEREWQIEKEQFMKYAKAYGLWEGVLESISDVVGLKALTGTLRKIAGDRVAAKIAAGLAEYLVGTATELGTELETQTLQHNIEIESGLKEGEKRSPFKWEDIVKSGKDVFKQTVALTTLMGTGATAHSAYKGHKKWSTAKDVRKAAGEIDINKKPLTEKELIDLYEPTEKQLKDIGFLDAWAKGYNDYIVEYADKIAEKMKSTKSETEIAKLKQNRQKAVSTLHKKSADLSKIIKSLKENIAKSEQLLNKSKSIGLSKEDIKSLKDTIDEMKSDLEVAKVEKKNVVNAINKITKADKKPVALTEDKIKGETLAQAQSTYSEALATQELEGTLNNVLISDNKSKSRKGRTLAVQISSDISKAGRDIGEDYYEKLYSGAREGYARPGEAIIESPDFWEIPTWIAMLSNNVENVDVYVVRNIDEAKAFVKNTDYDNVTFSVMDVNRQSVADIISEAKPDTKIALGAYTPETIQFFNNLGKENVKPYADIKQFIKDVGGKYKSGYDYSHFKGSRTIPRLALSKGCLYHCVFCDVKPYGTTQALPQAEIDAQVKSFVDLEAELIYLDDKTFSQTENYKQLPAIYEKILKANPNFQGFIIQTIPTVMNVRKFPKEFLQKSGIKYVELGIESYNDPILRLFKKPSSEKAIDSAVKFIRENRLSLIPNIIVGSNWTQAMADRVLKKYPNLTKREKALIKNLEENESSYKRTMNFLEKNKDIISHINLYNLAVYEDTALGQQVEAKTEADINENVVEKSAHKNKELHRKWYNKFKEYGMEQLDRIPTTKVEHKDFLSALRRAEKDPVKGKLIRENLTKYTPAQLKAMGAKTYLTLDGNAGFGITKDGELINVFSIKRSAGNMLVQTAIQNGAKHLNCYDGMLSGFYGRNGFVEYDREQNQIKGKPDIIYMKLKGVKNAEIRRSKRADVKKSGAQKRQAVGRKKSGKTGTRVENAGDGRAGKRKRKTKGGMTKKSKMELDAEEMQKIFDKQQREIEDYKKKHRITPAKIYRLLKQKLVDVSGNIKTILEKTETGRKVIMRHDLIAGASAKSAVEYSEIDKKIFKNLSKEEKQLLGNYRQALRSIEVEELGRGIKSPGTKEQNQAWLDNLKVQSPEVYKKIKSASEQIDKVMSEYLDLRKKEGLLTDEGYEALKAQYRYNPRKFLSHIDDEITYEFGSKKITVTNSGIKKLKKGSEGTLINDPEMLLAEYIARTNGIIFRNRTAKQLYEYAKENPKSDWLTIAPRTKSGKFQKTPAGKTNISAMIDGKEQRMWMSNDMAGEWVVRDPEISQGLAQAIRILSGSAILKPLATGINPEFAVANVPRDIAHILFITDEYSTFLPYAVSQIHQDMLEVAEDAIMRKGRYIDYIKEGGGMEFLTHQGRFKKHKIDGRKTVDNIQSVLGYAGETSEILTRLAVRERALKNGKSAEEATWIARNYLDFSQGGAWIKAADTGIPYLNAAFQATRGVFRGAKQHPYKFTAKAAQIGALAIALFYINRLKNPEALAQISDQSKARNWIITTPWYTINKDGTKKYFYFAIPKDQAQRVIAGVFEALAARKEDGILPSEKLLIEIKDFLPYIPTESLSPTMSAIMGYAQNRDFWTNEDIWKGAEVIPKEEYYINTPQFWVEFGKKTGLSPVRSQRASQKILTYRNVYTDIVGGMWHVMTEGMPEKDKIKLNKEIISKAPFSRRVFKGTYNKGRYEIKRLEIEENTRRLIQNREINKMTKQFINKEIKYNEIIRYINKQPKRDRGRLIKRSTRIIENVGIKPWLLDLGDIQSPEVRALVFYKRWQNTPKENRKELLQKIKNTKGIVSVKFTNEFERLLQTK